MNVERARPWEYEPDYARGTFAGLPWVICRNGNGALCGYVGVPASHPLFKKDYSDRVPAKRDQIALREETSPLDILCEAWTEDDGKVGLSLLFQPHGGITYSEETAPYTELDGNWYFGFDCSHTGDFNRKFPEWGGTYRTFAYVLQECHDFATNLTAYKEQQK